MMRRTIMIFPQFDNINVIDEIRGKYDPLANHVRPHITLVFTFESNLTSLGIKQHLNQVLSETSSFRLTMGDIIKIDNPLGMYLFFTIKEGVEEIKKLSLKLYEGILEPYKAAWFNEKTFLPHMTLGNFALRDELDNAYEEVISIKEKFTTKVNKVSVEIIDENEDSVIEVEMNLRNVNTP